MLYRAMFDRTLHTEIEIAAPPARVWAVLTDFDKWSEWNSVLLGMKLRGPLEVDTKAKLTINLGPPLGTKHASYERLNQRLRERCEASRADS